MSHAVMLVLVVTCVCCHTQEEALSDLNDLYALRRLDLSHNELTNLDSVEDMLRSKPNLTQLDMAGNPISRQPK